MSGDTRNTVSLTRGAFLRLIGAISAATILPGGNAMAARETMRTRDIPKTGEPLPVVGVGTWQTFDVGRDAASRAPLREVLEILFDAGGSVIDSSPMYGPAEGVAGDLLAAMGARDKAFIATKVWTEGRDRGIEQMTRSFRQFRTDRIELMQVHNLVDWRTHLETLAGWKADGKIRYTGITHYTPTAYDRIARIIETTDVDFVQLAYSIGVREAENRLLPLAAERGVAVIVNRPYEGGSVFRRTRGLDLPGWAKDFDCASWGQFSLKFILGHPAVTCVIPGTGRPEHMRDNVAAGFGRLPDEAERRRMAEFWREI